MPDPKQYSKKNIWFFLKERRHTWQTNKDRKLKRPSTHCDLFWGEINAKYLCKFWGFFYLFVYSVTWHTRWMYFFLIGKILVDRVLPADRQSHFKFFFVVDIAKTYANLECVCVRTTKEDERKDTKNWCLIQVIYWFRSLLPQPKPARLNTYKYGNDNVAKLPIGKISHKIDGLSSRIVLKTQKLFGFSLLFF